MKRKALGRGLSALLSEAPVESTDQKTILDIPIDLVEANRNQPRTLFDEDSLKELSESIRMQGILQPLLVRAHPDNPEMYQVVAGERRLRAARMASLETIPCILLEAEETKALEIALVENIQRSNLSPTEEARAFKYLAERFALTQEEIASRVGKSRESVANTLRLLLLPDEILHALEAGTISAGHAKVLLALRDTQSLAPTFERILREGLSVRETEQMVREITQPTLALPDAPKKVVEEDVHIAALERTLESAFQTKVRLKMKGKKKGVIEIQFYDFDQLDSLLTLWKVKTFD